MKKNFKKIKQSKKKKKSDLCIPIFGYSRCLLLAFWHSLYGNKENSYKVRREHENKNCIFRKKSNRDNHIATKEKWHQNETTKIKTTKNRNCKTAKCQSENFFFLFRSVLVFLNEWKIFKKNYVHKKFSDFFIPIMLLITCVYSPGLSM